MTREDQALASVCISMRIDEHLKLGPRHVLVRFNFTRDNILDLIDEGEQRVAPDSWGRVPRTKSDWIYNVRGLCAWESRALASHRIHYVLEALGGEEDNSCFYWSRDRRGFNQRMMMLAFMLEWLK